MKDVKWAITKLQECVTKASVFALKYEGKVREVQEEIRNSPDEERERLEFKKFAHYGRIYNAEEYIEDLEEVLSVLQTLNPSDSAVWIHEDKLEDVFGVFGDSCIQAEEVSNCTARVMECQPFTDGPSTWVICVSKTLGDL